MCSAIWMPKASPGSLSSAHHSKSLLKMLFACPLQEVAIKPSLCRLLVMSWQLIRSVDEHYFLNGSTTAIAKIRSRRSGFVNSPARGLNLPCQYVMTMKWEQLSPLSHVATFNIINTWANVDGARHFNGPPLDSFAIWYPSQTAADLDPFPLRTNINSYYPLLV